MVCAACGCDQAPGAQFCRQCGQKISMVSAAAGAAQQQQAWMPLQGVPAAYGMTLIEAEKRQRVRQNAQPLGITWILYGAYRMIGGLVAAFVLHHLAYGGMFGDAPPFLPHLMGSLVPVIATVSVVMGVAGLVVGYGLLARQPWARVLAIVFGILALLKIPFGTALGIYTLWVLVPGPAGLEWSSIAQEG
jgi:hypothetical protein